MLKAFARGLVGRLVSYGVFGLGFWWLFRGVQDDNIPLAVLGGAMVPAGLYLLVKVRRFSALTPAGDSQDREGACTEENAGRTPEPNETTDEVNRTQ